MSEITVPQLTKFFGEVQSGRISRESLQRFVEAPDAFNPAVGRFGRIWPVTVNYDHGWERLVTAGRFDWKNDDINPVNLPLIIGTGIREIGLELYEFDETVQGTEVEEKIGADGYQSEDFGALVAFGAKFPVEQRRRPIFALKQRWTDRGGDVHVPYLLGNGGERGLDLDGFQGDFGPYCRFLVSRK